MEELNWLTSKIRVCIESYKAWLLWYVLHAHSSAGFVSNYQLIVQYLTIQRG